MTGSFFIFENYVGKTMPYGTLSHVPKGIERVFVLKYIIDNCLDDNGPFNLYWNWKGEKYDFHSFISETLNEWIDFLVLKHQEYYFRKCEDEPLPQTLLRKENGMYILELQTYDYCDEGTSTIFELQEKDLIEYLETFQNEGLYDCMEEYLP